MLRVEKFGGKKWFFKKILCWELKNCTQQRASQLVLGKEIFAVWFFYREFFCWLSANKPLCRVFFVWFSAKTQTLSKACDSGSDSRCVESNGVKKTSNISPFTGTRSWTGRIFSFSFYVELPMPKKYTKCTNMWKKLTSLDFIDLEVFLEFFNFLTFLNLNSLFFNRTGRNRSEPLPVRTSFTGYHGKLAGSHLFFFWEAPKRVYSYLIHNKENNWQCKGNTAWHTKAQRK
jgi:hypothetical protein